MNEFLGKKLLILGGTTLSINIVEVAKSMGIYTIVMDMSPDSPTKKVADKAYDISTANVDDVVSVARKECVDGIFTSYEDFNTGIAAAACEKLGLPFYATLHQIDLTRNKLQFKALCRENGINAVDEFHLDGSFSPEDLALMEYPVIIKPADSYAARGISICYNQDELLNAYPHAVSFSRTKQVIVERYMNGDYVSVTFSIQNGQVSLSAMNDKAVNEEQQHIVRLPAAYVFPSKYIDICYEQLLPGLQSMAKQIGLHSGTFSVEAVVVNNKFYVFEMSFRIGGVNDWKFVLMENNINHMEMYIRYALTGKFEGADLPHRENPRFRHSYCLLNVLLRPGRISKIEGAEQVSQMPFVFRYAQNYQEGDNVTWPGTLRQIFSKVFVKADSKKELLSNIQSVMNTLKVYDCHGTDLVMRDANIETTIS